jgi:sulfane dehydrogenase subunit SoxC
MTKKNELNVTRRTALLGMAGAAGTVLARTAAGQDVQVSGSNRPVAPEDSSKVLGSRWSTDLGQRSPYEALKRVPSHTLSSSETPLQDLHGTITPSDLHFERHHAGVPLIDPDKHKCRSSIRTSTSWSFTAWLSAP